MSMILKIWYNIIDDVFIYHHDFVTSLDLVYVKVASKFIQFFGGIDFYAP